METLVIPERFNGPPGSANGGYACGAVAALVDAAVVTARLHRPPPLGVPLRVERDGASVRLLADDDVVASARRGEPLDVTPRPVRVEAARAAEARYGGLVAHPFPTCFACGPARPPGDGLHLAPGPVARNTVACTWTPESEWGGADGVLPATLVWTALDCPSGWANDQIATTPMVLGEMTATLHAPVRAGTTYVLTAARAGDDGRRSYATSTVQTAAGELVAAARATWFPLPSS